MGHRQVAYIERRGVFQRVFLLFGGSISPLSLISIELALFVLPQPAVSRMRRVEITMSWKACLPCPSSMRWACQAYRRYFA